VISNYLQRKEDYTEIIKIVIANPHPLVKIQGIAAINRTYFPNVPKLICSIGIQFSSPSSDQEEDTFENHEDFQKYAIQLIQAMASAEASDLSGLLVRCLSCILSLDPMIGYSTPAMDLAIHYLTILPEHPETRHTLSDTISSILPKLCSAGHPDAPASIREKNFHWLQAVLNMVKTASQRPKGDSLISVYLLVEFADLGIYCGIASIFDMVGWSIAFWNCWANISCARGDSSSRGRFIRSCGLFRYGSI
jgi:hypothetical protein